jgi:hypothetical protein
MSSRPPIISCVTCGEVFEKQTALKKHRENKHPNGTTFKVGEKEYDLIHGVQEGKFMCPICGCPVSRKNNLRRHVIKCEEKYQPQSDMESASEHSQSDDDGSREERITENGKETSDKSDEVLIEALGQTVRFEGTAHQIRTVCRN